MSSVRENLDRIRAAIGNPRVRILGVTKAQPSEAVAEAVDAGLTLLGNNYVQEGERLREALAGRNLEWHFIGHLQSRKARDVVSYDCVQSVDRSSVAEELAKRAQAAGRTLPILVEVNVGGEASKSGVAWGDADVFLEQVAGLAGLRLSGLMAMPPPLEPIEARRPYFRRMRQLFERHEKAYGLNCLSMGTSDDYTVAAEEGATLVRLGTALFGPRSR